MQSDAPFVLALALTPGLASRLVCPRVRRLTRRMESPCHSSRSRVLPSPGSSLASHRKEGKLQAGRERISGHSEDSGAMDANGRAIGVLGTGIDGTGRDY